VYRVSSGIFSRVRPSAQIKCAEFDCKNSDSLQRHMIRHGNLPTPSGRSKRACVTCHASKIKCDGDQSCSRCLKKGVKCIYDQQDPPLQREALVEKSSEESTVIPSTAPLASSNIPPTAPVQLSVVPNGENFAAQGLEWVLSSRIEKGSTSPWIRDDDPLGLSDFLMQKYAELYFSHFHHRWPIIHSPTWQADAPNIMASSVYMIGAWLEGTRGSKEFAISKHGRLMGHISRRLVCP